MSAKHEYVLRNNEGKSLGNGMTLEVFSQPVRRGDLIYLAGAMYEVVRVVHAPHEQPPYMALKLERASDSQWEKHHA